MGPVLKILLGILLFILLLFLLLLLMLSVPIRYEGRLKQDEKTDIQGKITYLFKIFSLNLSYQEGKFDGYLMLLHLFKISLNPASGKKNEKKPETSGNEEHKEKSSPEEILNKIKGIFNKLSGHSPEIRQILQIVKKMILSVLPKKLKGSLAIGFEDPSDTGTFLALIGPFYPLYRNDFNVTPNFQEKEMKADLWIQGRISLIRILWLGIPLILRKNLREFLFDMIKGEEE